jgi:hypothetical protein
MLGLPAVASVVGVAVGLHAARHPACPAQSLRPPADHREQMARINEFMSKQGDVYRWELEQTRKILKTFEARPDRDKWAEVIAKLKMSEKLLEQSIERHDSGPWGDPKLHRTH